jgi:hypothetical protein
MPNSRLAVTLDRIATSDEAANISAWLMGWLLDDIAEPSDAAPYQFTAAGDLLTIATHYPVTDKMIEEFMNEVNCYVEGDLEEHQARVERADLATSA